MEQASPVGGHPHASFLKRVGQLCAAPFNAFEWLLTTILMMMVRPLWRKLDQLSPRFEKTMAARIIAVMIFPILLSAAVVAGFAMVKGGVSPNALGYAILWLLMLGMIMAPLERLMPWSRKWLHARDSGTDTMMIVSNGLFSFLAGPVSIFLTAWLVDWIHQELPESTIRGFWPSQLPGVVQVALLTVVMDFFRYWYHRWMHETPFMWRWHAVHHSSTRLYWFNALRSHPLESVISNLIWVVPFTLIKAPAEIVFVAGFVSVTIGRFQHTNINTRLGIFEYIFSGPMNHRYHHAKDVENGNSNYGGDVIIWDHLFGTFHLPKDREPSDDIGVGGVPHYPQTWAGLILAPFRNDLKKVEGK